MYKDYYDEYCNEVHGAISCYLLWRYVHNRAYNDKAIEKALNKSPLSWNTILHSLQVTLFITLGRIFDIDKDAFSADVLLRTCMEEIELFSDANLRLRKIQRNGNVPPSWLDDYMKGTVVPSRQDFGRIRGELSKKKKIFEANYKPIRHKLIAHMDKSYIGKEDALWAATNIKELEDLLWFLNDIKEILFDVYENGRPVELRRRDPDVKFFEKDFMKLIEAVSA
jgi:hypothetical protein